ncbi:DNA excision repair protein ERCC-1 isoform X2 [Monodon monoceros]|uniref:DNA excision repair protein ERCC-1 isoform X2 n=1 Tax=Monodon monoceros TaxID=40151 RepID=UPI0010F72FAC|nr:DNA excision repair protein ERCC-1 isoform X2 [Monodon monoceros]
MRAAIADTSLCSWVAKPPHPVRASALCGQSRQSRGWALLPKTSCAAPPPDPGIHSLGFPGLHLKPKVLLFLGEESGGPPFQGVRARHPSLPVPACPFLEGLRYHSLHPDYIHGRLQSLGKSFALRVLLVQVDVKDPQQALKELAKMCILADCTLILAWSPEEAGRYLETYKAYEQKPADLLMEKLEQDFVSRVTECLTTVKSVNKTDSQTLLTTFGSLEQLIAASREDLALCPGLGPQKARRLFDVLHEPFLKVPR